MNKPRKLFFSFDPESRKKFLLFLESILNFSNEECSNIFSFSKSNIVCKNEYYSSENTKEIKAYHYYTVVKDNEDSNENSFKDYCLESSLNLITLLLKHEDLERFRDLLKHFEKCISYEFTAKRNEALNQYYLQVNILMQDSVKYNPAIKFHSLKSIHDVFLFNRELCFFINFQHQLKYLIIFLEKSKNKEKKSFTKIEISKSGENKVNIIFKFENKNKILFKNLSVQNEENYNLKFNEFYVKTSDLYSIVVSQKSSSLYGIFLFDQIFFAFTYYNTLCDNYYFSSTYALIDFHQNIEDNF